MAKRYQHRIGVRAELCFNIVLDTRNPSPDQLAQAVTEILKGCRGLRRRFQAGRTARGLGVRGLEQR